MGALGTWLQASWSRLRLRACADVGEGVVVAGRVWIHGNGQLTLGRGVRLDASRAPIELHAADGAQIVIGDEVLIEGGTSIEARQSIVIGDRARIRAYCKILDNHFHPLRGDRLQLPPSDPVVLGPDVDLGERSIVLPGAWLAPGAVVGPSKIVRAPPPGARRASGKE
jgi:acetyltransferase-like isoleucine patch superfamily enzyme